MKSMYAVTLAAMLLVVGYAAGARAQDYHEFRNNYYIGNCLEVRNASQKPGARVQHGPCTLFPHQMFRFVPSDLGDGTVKIMALHSLKCLQVAESTHDRGFLVLVQATCLTSQLRQNFTIVGYPTPPYQHLRWIQAKATSSGKIVQCVAANDRYIVQRRKSASSDQLWDGFPNP